MKNLPLLWLVLAGLLLTACQAHRRAVNNAAAILNQLNQMAAEDIAHEQNGEPPPRGFATWPAYWQNRFAALQLTPGNPRQGNTDPRHLASANLAFIKQRRAAAGLPPVDEPAPF